VFNSKLTLSSAPAVIEFREHFKQENSKGFSLSSFEANGLSGKSVEYVKLKASLSVKVKRPSERVMRERTFGKEI
jgi:hypothetical protein